jgi:hypothetical protein
MNNAIRRSVSLLPGALLLTGAALATVLPAGPAQQGPGEIRAAHLRQVDQGFAPGCIGYCKRPTNAAKVFRWGVEEWRREFENRKIAKAEGRWSATPSSAIEQREGMLTIHAYPNDTLVTVTAADQAAEYGRWESRVRAVEEERGGTPFTFEWELTPSGDSGCDAEGITLSQYTPGTPRARGEVRKAPDTAFQFSRKLDLRSRAWHTYAVEVTPDHISWFVDTQVVRTERRPEALAAVELRPQFQIIGQAGQQMRTSRMQMDWVRYYDLERPNAKSIDARQMKQGVFTPGCRTAADARAVRQARKAAHALRAPEERRVSLWAPAARVN